MVSDNELVKTKALLDREIMSLTMNGMEVPSQLLGEFEKVQAKIATNSVQQLGSSMDWTEWLGKTLNGFTISHLVHIGSFSYVFEAKQNLSDDLENPSEKCALKIAKSNLEAKEQLKKSPQLETMVLMRLENQFKPVQIHHNFVLEQQILKLQNPQGKNAANIVQIIDSGYWHDTAFYRMPLYSAPTLWQLHIENQRGTPNLLDKFIEVLRAYKESSKSLQDKVHGNLNPAHILIDKTGPIFLDCGYQGPIQPMRPGSVPHQGLITSPWYYPLFNQVPLDDNLALGLMLWELVSGKHPLANKENGFSYANLLLDLATSESTPDLIYINPIIEILKNSANLLPDWLKPLLLRAIGLSNDGNKPSGQNLEELIDLADTIKTKIKG